MNIISCVKIYLVFLFSPLYPYPIVKVWDVTHVYMPYYSSYCYLEPLMIFKEERPY